MVVGIGITEHDASMVSTGIIEHAEIDAIRSLGGIGEVLGHFFDDDGRPIETEATQRILTLPLERLRNRRMVAIAGGTVKVRAINAVLESGLLAGLIIDERTARALAEMTRSASGNGKASHG